MPRVEVVVINQSTILTDDTVKHMIAALQTQVIRDFAPIWGQSATLEFIPKDGTPRKGTWWLVFIDDADAAGALGYHDMTPDGHPLGKVFVKTAQQYNTSVSVVASHELLELLADPYVNRCYEGTDQGTFFMCEVCDACEGDDYGYSIGDVLVSDFVYPAWFTPTLLNHQLDHGKHLTTPFEILPGGYIGKFQDGTWSQVKSTGEAAGTDADLCDDRMKRRQIDRGSWVPSKRV